MDFRKVGSILVAAGVVIIAASILLPQESELELTKIVTGSQAVEMVKSIHIGNFDVESAVIAEFNGGSIRVWIAYADSPQTAEMLTEEMAKNVGKFFSTPEKVRIDSLETYRVYGNGRVHYFFSHKNAVVWVEFESRDMNFQKEIIERLFLKGEMEKYIN